MAIIMNSSQKIRTSLISVFNRCFQAPPACTKTLILVICFLTSLGLKAQNPQGTPAVDLAKILTHKPLFDECLYTTVKRDSIPDMDIVFLKISQKIPEAFEDNIPISVVARNVVLSFNLANGSDSISRGYFFPGLYCRTIQLFKVAANEPEKLIPVINPPDLPTSLTGYVFIQLSPHEKAKFIAKLDFVPTADNILSPRIINKSFIYYFKMTLLGHKVTVNVFSYVMAGILLMMIIYSISAYFQDYNYEFLFYAKYALAMGLVLFFKSYLFGVTNEFHYYFEGCIDFLVQMVGYSFYLLFIRKFLNTKLLHPSLEKVLAFANWFILVIMVVFSIFYFGTDLLAITHLVENISKMGLFMMSAIFILYGLWRKDPLMNYIIAGQLFLTVFGIISFMLSITPLKFSDDPGSIGNDALFYYQLGMVFELIFFMSGLTYKNKKNLTERVKERERLKLENERKEFEKQVAILEAKQQERNRISADMHDELGSGVTAIRLMSEIVKTKMKESTLPEIEKISHSANELLSKMNTIIWTMVSSNDTAESLIAYIRAYAVEFFENTSIECQFNLPSYIPPAEISGEKRRNVFLSVKEALNNVLKHSQASEIAITMMVTDKLIIEIADNGVGINMDKIRKFGNGLNNMKKRIDSISGIFRIENHQGTKVFFELEFD